MSASVGIPSAFATNESLTTSDGTLRVGLGVYGLEPVFQAAYKFSDRCFIFIQEDGPGHLRIEFRRRSPASDIPELIGLFSNELVDQALRLMIARDTRAIREQLYAQAFGEARFGDSV